MKLLDNKKRKIELNKLFISKENVHLETGSSEDSLVSLELFCNLEAYVRVWDYNLLSEISEDDVRGELLNHRRVLLYKSANKSNFDSNFNYFGYDYLLKTNNSEFVKYLSYDGKIKMKMKGLVEGTFLYSLNDYCFYLKSATKSYFFVIPRKTPKLNLTVNMVYFYNYLMNMGRGIFNNFLLKLNLLQFKRFRIKRDIFLLNLNKEFYIKFNRYIKFLFKINYLKVYIKTVEYLSILNLVVDDLICLLKSLLENQLRLNLYDVYDNNKVLTSINSYRKKRNTRSLATNTNNRFVDLESISRKRFGFIVLKKKRKKRRRRRRNATVR